MKIEHLAIWVIDLEGMKDFYIQFFDGVAGEKYHNASKQFTSYFISFSTGPRIELMHQPDLAMTTEFHHQTNVGLAHFAMSLGSKFAVDALTEQLRQAGYEIVGEPRTTGDGYYESVVLDPEGNRVEITE